VTRPRAAYLLTGVSLLLVDACTVGPNYRVPDHALVKSPAATGAFVASSDRSVSVAPLPRHWWRLYDSSELDSLIRQALAENTDLRAANANLEYSQALVREATTLRQPSIAVGAGVEYAQLAGEQYLLDITPPRNTFYDAGVTIGYDLDLFGGIRRGIEAARADDEAVEAARDLVRVNVAAESARAYADVCGAGLQLVAARKSLALQKRSLELTKELRERGRAIDLDVTRSQQLVDELTGAIPGLEALRRNALYRLTTLTGRPPSEFDAKLEGCATPPRLMEPLPIGDGAALLKRRPDVREAERQLAAATAAIGVATAQLYPDITLGVAAGSLGVHSDVLTSPTNYWQLGSILAWQANQSAARDRMAGANAQAKLALAHFDGTVLTALNDAESALNTYEHDLQREASTKAARDEAARVEKDVERLEVGGRATALDVIDAQRTLASAEQSLAQLESAISADQVAVFLALGGGWETES
jgi:NodT family efflux transporter outer membrane factor (OMF) lipoprotein